MSGTDVFTASDVIPAKLDRRLAAHAMTAGAWLPMLQEWIDRYVDLRREFEHAVHTHPLGHIDDVFDAVADESSFRLMRAVTQVVREELARSDAIDPAERSDETAAFMDWLDRALGGPL